MAKYIIEDTTLKNIADAIRDKNGESEQYTPEEMPAKIEEIQGGGGYLGITNKYAYGGGADLSNIAEDAEKYILNCSNMFRDVTVANNDIEMINALEIVPCDMSYMYYYNQNITKFQNCRWDTSNVTDFSYMFYYCQNLEQVDMSNLDFSECRNVAYMFRMCNDTAGTTKCILPEKTCNKIEDFSNMFSNATFAEIMNVDKLLPTNATTTAYMFSNSDAVELDLSTWGENKITTMEYMFNGCDQLVALDISNLDTSNVTTMYYMFYNCKKLTRLDLSNFNVEKVTNFNYAVYNLDSLKYLNLGNLNFASLSSFSGFTIKPVAGMEIILPNLPKVTSTTIGILYSTTSYAIRLTFGEGNSFSQNVTTSTVSLNLTTLWRVAESTVAFEDTGETFGNLYEAFANSIAENTSGKTRNIKLYTTFYNSLTDEQKALLTNKNYTITYGTS